MGLSYDLISEFVKITNDKKENTKEGTVYATVVSGTGGKYVRIDGSDLLTPMDTTTDIEDGERVTLMIKDHKAIVTGNVTTPSASTSKVDKVTESVNSVSDRVGTFELVVADKVSTNELEAYKATIEVLIANKATIEDLTATNAKIENLEVKNAEIENLVAGKATIEDLEAVNATIENLKVKDAEIENAVVENLKATTADIKILNADFAQIKTLVNGNLTSDNILSFNLTSEKVTVDDAFIKDAMIDTISAGKINAGEINTNLVSIGSEDGGMLITGSTQQFTDKNGNVRIQIGKDASGDFTFILYGENGQGQIINQNGITASAIGDGLIVNNMVSDNAAISGGKLDISSVITEINSDNSTTIRSSKIYLNDQAQSLEVAFNSLKTQVDTIQEVTIKGDLTAIVEQVQSNTSKIEVNKNSINTLISEDTVIKKQVTDLQGTLNETETTLNSKYTALSQNLDGFKTTVSDTYATKKSVTDVVDNIETNYSTTSVMNSAIEQKAQEISASVSSTYATKNQVNTLDNTLRQDYSTTQQMESAINVAKEEINLGVSTIYETKENTTSKVQNAVNNIQIGGTNLWVISDLVTGWVHNDGTITGTGIQHKTRQTIIPTNGAKQLVYQCWNPNRVQNGGNTNRVGFFDSNENYMGSTDVLILNGDSYQYQLINIPENAVYVRLGAICGPTDFYDETIKIKFELGNKPTDYSLAPEDVQSEITIAKEEAIDSANNTLTTTIANYYTKSQTDSQINVAKEEINLGVSTTYETKTNVETKVTSTLNSAKSYADTKKSEAINTAASDATSKANTAKQEAITSANNTLTTTIANYYTKSQTDSQINVAKEEISLGVSNLRTEIINTHFNNLLWNSDFLIDDETTNFYKGYFRSTDVCVSKGGWICPEGGKTILVDTLAHDVNCIGFVTPTIRINKDQILTASVYVATDNIDNIDQQLGIEIQWIGSDGNRINVSGKGFELSSNHTWERVSVTGTAPEGAVNANIYCWIRHKGVTWWGKPMLQFGPTCTAWDRGGDFDNINERLSSAELKITDDSIIATVSGIYETKTTVQNKIDNIQVGGTNLWVLNDLVTGWENSDGTITGTGVQHKTRQTIIPTNGARELVYQCWNPNRVQNGGNSNRVAFFDSNGNHISSTAVIVLNGDSYQHQLIIIPENAVYVRLGAICGPTDFYDETIKIKFEFGNKPTDYNLAPEDVQSEFSTIESETRSIRETMTSLQLGSDSINASVKSLEESMVNTTNGLSSDISRIQDQVNLKMTSDDVKLEIQKEMSKGANKVSTSTGFTFDQNGLNISKTDSEMKTQITEDGMKIYKNDEVMLTANNQGVDAKNLHATTYLIIGNNSRMEDFTEGGNKRTAVFWIG